LGLRTSLIDRLNPTFFLAPPIFSNIAIYNFDPKLPKKLPLYTGKAEIEEVGSNLAIVLKNIIEIRTKRENSLI
jgi:hypothetical protein